MPVYQDSREVKVVPIRGVEGGEAEIYNTLLWGDIEDIYSDEKLTDIQKARRALGRLIKSWNLTDKDEKKLPTDEKTLRGFTIDVITDLLSHTDFAPEGGFGEAEKKK